MIPIRKQELDEMVETTENEDIGRVDILESIDYPDKITMADGVKLVINAVPGYKRFFKDNLTDPIEFIFAEGENAEIRGVLFHSATIFVAAIFNLSNLKKN